MKCPICNKELNIESSQEDYNHYLDEDIEESTIYCQGCNTHSIIAKYRGLQFYCSPNGVVKLLNKSKSTQIKYVIRSSIYNSAIYYDLICIYNKEENWIKSIPVPIFVKLLAPYLGDKVLEQELSKVTEIEESSDYDRDVIDYWGYQLALENIDFLRLFIINMKYNYTSMKEVPDDISINNCFISDNEWKDLKMYFKQDLLTLQATTFKPVLDKLGFEFCDDNDINDYHHGIYSVLSCEVYKDDDYGYKYNWYPTVDEIEAGYNENPDDYRQEPRWGHKGCYSFLCEYANYEQQNEGCSSDYDDLLSYIESILFYLNPNTLEKDYRQTINRSFPNENVTIDVYIDVYEPKIRWYRKKKLLWNQKVFNDIQQTFNTCKQHYEKLLENRDM